MIEVESNQSMIPLDTEAQDINIYLIQAKNLQFDKVIGSGGYGEVFLGCYLPTNTKVAIKRLFEMNESERIKQVFLREIHTLALAKNQFLLPFVGYTNTPPYCIITKYMNNGSLYDILHNTNVPVPKKTKRSASVKHSSKSQKQSKNRSRSKNINPLDQSSIQSDTSPNPNEHLTTSKLTPAQKTLIAYGISTGMQFLHSKNLIHRDLKTQNVLLDDDFAPVICDFGSSRFLEGSSSMTGSLGTTNYMAPEFIQGSEYNLSIDVYSYGMILWEMLTEQVPFSGLESAQVILKTVIQQSRPPIPENTPHNLTILIERCWSPNPIDRPPFEQITKLFENKSIEFPGIDHDEYNALIQKVMPHYRIGPLRRHSDSCQYNAMDSTDQKSSAYNLRQTRVCKSSMVINNLQPNLFSLAKTVEESLEALKGDNIGEIRKALDFFESISNERIMAQIDIWPSLLAFVQSARTVNNEQVGQPVNFANPRSNNLELTHNATNELFECIETQRNINTFRNNVQISKSSSVNLDAFAGDFPQNQDANSQSIDLSSRTKSFELLNLNSKRSNPPRNYNSINYDMFIIPNSNETCPNDSILSDLIKKAEMLIEHFGGIFEILETIKRVPDLHLYFFANDSILYLFLCIATNLPQLIDTKIVSQLFNLFQDRRYSLRAASLVCHTVKNTPDRKMVIDILDHLQQNISNYVDMIGGNLILKLLLSHNYLKTDDISMFSRSDLEDNVISAYQCLFSIKGPPELFSLSNVLLNCLSLNEGLRDVACEFIRRYAVGADNEPLMLISTTMFKMIFQYESEKALLLLVRVSSDPKRCSCLINTGFISDFLNAKPTTALLLLKVFLTIIKADERCKKYFFIQPQISTYFANVASNNDEEADISLCWSLNQITVLPELAVNLVKSQFIQIICDYITLPIPKTKIRDTNNSILLDEDSSSSSNSSHYHSSPRAFSMHPIKLSWFLRTIATVSPLADCDRYNNIVKLLFSLIEQKSVISHNCLITLAALSMQVSTHEMMYHGMQTVLSRYIDNNENQASFVNQIMMNIKKGGRIRT